MLLLSCFQYAGMRLAEFPSEHKPNLIFEVGLDVSTHRGPPGEASCAVSPLVDLTRLAQVSVLRSECEAGAGTLSGLLMVMNREIEEHDEQ